MTTLDPITWTPSTAKVGDLLPKGWKRNPRYSTPSTVDGLKKLLERFGQYNRVLIDGNGTVDGHQRIAAWYKLYGKDFEALTNVASRNLTEKEREDFTLLNHAGAMGAWNFEELGNWELDTLALGGFGEEMLEGLNQQQAFLMELLGKDGGDEDGEENNPYDEWKGMPEFENDTVDGAIHTVKVHFATQEDIDRFAAIVGQTVTDKSTYIWFPKKDKENLKLYRVSDES